MRIDGTDMLVHVPPATANACALGLIGTRQDDGEWRLPWTYNNAFNLANADVPVITPMPRDYKFSGKFTPKAYQVQASDFLAARRRAYMFLPPGSGKTVTSLWAADYLLGIGAVSKVLVICTRSIMYTAWAEEIREHFRHRSYTVLEGGDSRKRAKRAERPTHFHVINHDGVHFIQAALCAANYDLIILDESTAAQNTGSRRWKAIRKLVRPTTRLWEMTGTPIPQSPENAHGQIRLMGNVDDEGNYITPGGDVPAFMSAERWKTETMIHASGYRWEPKRDSNATVFRFMKPAFRRSKREILPELPVPMPQRYELPLTPAQETAIKDLTKEKVYDVSESHVVTAVNAGVLLSKVIQVCTGIAYAEPVEAGYDEGGERVVQRFKTEAKKAQMMDLIEQAQAKALVYVPFVAALEDVASHIRSHGYNVAILQGKVTSRKLAEVMTAFQSDAADAPHVIVAIPQKMSHGVTATAADLIVWYSPVLRAEVYQQANERTDRIGQTRVTQIAHLSSCDVERKLYDRLESRTLTQEAFLDMYSELVRSK